LTRFPTETKMAGILASGGQMASSHRAAVVALGLIACTHREPAPVGERSSPASALLPSGLTPDSRPACREAEGRVAEGIALQDELNRAVVCVVGRLPPGEVNAFLARVGQQRLVQLPARCLPPAVRARVPVEAGKLAVHVYVSEAARAELPVCQQLEAGSWRGTHLSLGGGNRGHSDATAEAAASLAAAGIPISAAGRAILADASQDPDFFQWTVMAAHSQTPDDGGLPGSRAAAQAAAVEWVHDRLKSIKPLCTAGDDASIRDALYWLGYSVHALEDLAAHRGRTNPEHRFDAKVEGCNPDESRIAFPLAVDMAREYLRRLLEGPLAACRPGFARFGGSQVDWSEKVGHFGLHRDLDADTFTAYEDSWRIFEAVKTKPGVRVRWFAESLVGPAECGASTPVECRSEPACRALLDRMVAAGGP
jgi:hypothetical protein